jgi:hypothetical protein
MAQNNEIPRPNTPAMEYCMEQIKQSGNPGSEVVIGAMALWVAAHGDFELPEQPKAEQEPKQEFEELVPIEPLVANNIARIAFGDSKLREPAITSLEAIDANADLSNTFKDIFAPYVVGLNAKVQLAEQSFGRTNRVRNYNWQDSQVLYDLMTNVFFKASYVEHDSYNEPKALEVTYTTENKPHKNDLHINLTLKNAGVDSLTITSVRSSSWVHSGNQALMQGLINTFPSREIHRHNDSIPTWDTGIFKGEIAYKIGSVHTFSFQDNAVRVTSESDELIITRQFNPETNMFENSKYNKDKKQTTVGKDMSPEIVISFVRELLGTLPRFKESSL